MAPFSINAFKAVCKFYLAGESSLLEYKERDAYQLPNGKHTFVKKYRDPRMCVCLNDFVFY